MKKLVAGLIVVGIIFSVASPAHAGTPLRKLGRGLSNIITMPLAMAQGMGEATEEGGVIAGVTWGVFQGLFNVVKRVSAGVYEVVTFPVPVPAGYEPILTDPEFYLETADDD